jgi:hypothetical protein
MGMEIFEEIKFYFKHLSSLGVLVTLIVYIYYATSAFSFMKEAQNINLNIDADTYTFIDDSVWNYQKNYLNMYVTFGVGIILALTVLSVKKESLIKYKSMKNINNYFRIALSLGVIASLGTFIYYGSNSVDVLKRTQSDAATNIWSKDYQNVNSDIFSYQLNRMNAEISFHVAVLLTLMVMGIKEY